MRPSLGLGSGASAAVHTLDDGEYGWVQSRAKDAEHMHAMFAHVLHYVRDVEARSVDLTTRDERVLSDPLEECPDKADNPEYYEQVARPTCLQAITHRVVHCEYAAPALFEQDMLQLFANARRWYGVGTDGYAEMATLQRLYNALTPSQGRLTDALGVRHVKPRTSDVDVVTAMRAKAKPAQRFASSAYGPGHTPPGVATDAVPIAAAPFKGRVYRVGDWVHLMNPVDPARPIVGQVFRLYKRRKVPGVFLTACWYYRPEQTHHAPSRLFYPDEVVKTGVFAEHALEDVLEDVFVLPVAVYARARPAPAFCRPDMPVYVVESKYDVVRHTFHRIEDWTQCVPREVRAVETPLDEYAAELPRKVPSPLARGEAVAGGALVDESALPHARDEWPNLFTDAVCVSIPTLTQTPAAPPASAAAPPAPAAAPLAPAPSHADRLRAYAAFHAAAADIARRTTPAAYAQLQARVLARPDASHAALTAAALEAGVHPRSVLHLRDAGVAAGVLDGASPAPAPAPAPALPSAAAVFASHAQGAECAPLPDDVRALFRQADGRVLWYAAPPLPGWQGARAVLDGTTPLPLPSGAYLTYIAE